MTTTEADRDELTTALTEANARAKACKTACPEWDAAHAAIDEALDGLVGK